VFNQQERLLFAYRQHYALFGHVESSVQHTMNWKLLK